MNWARQERLIEWVDLFVFAHNEPTRALYRSLAFHELATVHDRFRVDGQTIDDIHMTLHLGRAT